MNRFNDKQNSCCKSICNAEDGDRCAIVIPTNLEDYNEPPYRGTIQQLMYLNIGRTVTIEYLENSSDLRAVTGVVEAVTVKYIILRTCNNLRQMGDIFAIRFITFHCD